MSLDERPPEPTTQGTTQLRREFRHDGRIYEVEVSASPDEHITLAFSSCNEDGERISHLAGELAVDDLALSADILQGMLHGLAMTYRVPPDSRAYTVAGKRTRHRNAYARWTADEDDKLRNLHRAGTSIEQLCEEFGRNEGAIQSRLAKLDETPRTDAADGA